ncbi:hypothetical protein AAHA92_26590 [Salvia divinorum]|uniref:Uncharacterized protein n=1 Tax=Salvia divinorum TaxID=28513 RepID=A0ABD1GER2_SALDI
MVLFQIPYCRSNTDQEDCSPLPSTCERQLQPTRDNRLRGIDSSSHRKKPTTDKFQRSEDYNISVLGR